MKKKKMINIALLCGGPSPERGISLNSARSVLDHLSADDISIVPIYFDYKKQAYQLSTAQLYSNTPSDFDFKLQHTAKALNQTQLLRLLKQVDLTFPVMHGCFGEDGGIQHFLEKNAIPFVGSSARTCRQVFDKFTANEAIASQGFFTLSSMVLTKKDNHRLKKIKSFFKRHQLKRAIVKPASGGSSIGVFSVSTAEEALEKVDFLLNQNIYKRVVIEPFAKGIEFTIIILHNRFHLPVALVPTEIEADYDKHQIFDFRKKYLPNRSVIYHCPPRFDDNTIEKIRVQAEQLFALFSMRDFARFDGWVLPDGRIWFSDFNPISGMEQNSFLFMQAARVGMSHSDVLRHVIAHACSRYHIPFNARKTTLSKKRKPVHILFGGSNAERQVSLMSGTNVWLKLRNSQRYQPIPFLLDEHNHVWQLPYQLALNHTVEEIAASCKRYHHDENCLYAFEKSARQRLGLFYDSCDKEFSSPKKMRLNQFIQQSPFVFIALHGGIGENGTLQAKLMKDRVKFNGPNEQTARLCMNKWLSAKAVTAATIPGVYAIAGKRYAVKSLLARDEQQLQALWETLKRQLNCDSFIIKPARDGCSAGVARLDQFSDLKKYLHFIQQNVEFIRADVFSWKNTIIEMPTIQPKYLLIEKFITTDTLAIKHNHIQHHQYSGWLELTVAVVEQRQKNKKTIHVFHPSITVSSGEILTVEEKFQGGSGVNITPPPADIIAPALLRKIKRRIKQLAEHIGINGYVRIDMFVNINNGDIMIIEINALPALTPSTVFYHQALAEKKPLSPTQLLEQIIGNKHGY